MKRSAEPSLFDSIEEEAQLGMSPTDADGPVVHDLPSWVTPATAIDPDDPEVRDLIALLGRMYVGRRNPVPIRKPGGTWHAEHRDLTLADFHGHFGGTHLLGGYLLDENNKTGCVVADIDADGDFREQMLAGDTFAMARMAHYGYAFASAMGWVFQIRPYATLTGGKGLHVIIPFWRREDAVAVRAVFNWLVAARLGLELENGRWHSSAGDWHLECYPKQDTTGTDGLGNLIRLPYGRDPGTGRWGHKINTIGVDLVRRDDVEHPDSTKDILEQLYSEYFPPVVLENGCKEILAARPDWGWAVMAVIRSGACYGPQAAIGCVDALLDALDASTGVANMNDTEQ